MKNIFDFNKNNKGVTMISLVVTIIVLIILASIAGTSAKETINSSRLTKFTTELKLMQVNVNQIYDSWKNGGNVKCGTNTYTGDDIINNIGQDIDSANTDIRNQANIVFTAIGITNKEEQKKYMYFDKKTIEDLGIEDIEQEFLVNIQDRKIISYLGLKYYNEMFYTLEQVPNGLYNVEYTPNTSVPTFDVSVEQVDDNRWKIDISNIQYQNGYIQKWKVKYKLSDSEKWNTSDNLSFIVSEIGKYNIIIFNGDIKSAEENEENIYSIYVWDSNFNEKGVNKPKLSEGMIPVKYNGTNWVICTEDDPDWYNYIDTNGNGTVETEEMKWANVMLSDGEYKVGVNAEKDTIIDNDSKLGSMFVWIPRYAYKINEYKTEKNAEGTTQNITDVTFLVGETNRDKEGKRYNTDYDTNEAEIGKETPKIVHPGFSFGGKELTGIWMAKFEASMEEENGNLYTTNNNTTKTLKIVPNADTWRYIQIGNMFTNCLDMKTEEIYGINNTADSHLTKNVEWGAITYLSASQYGITPNKNDSGTKYGTVGNVDQYHSYSAKGDYKTNKNQSTTGNETGIYDLNGGAWEYVAAYWDNGHGNLSGQGLTTYFQNNKLKIEYEKYWDKYDVSDNEKTQMKEGLWNKDATANKIRKQITEERYNLMKDKKGDALYEVINTYSYYGKKTDGNSDWLIDEQSDTYQFGESYYNKDFALIGNTSLPFLLRGGVWSNVSKAGVFASEGHHGYAYHYLGFRPVLVVQ